MADSKKAWDEVAERFSELGLKLKLHFEQAGGDEAEKEKAESALRSLREAVDHAFSAVGTAARDDAVRDDLKDVGRSLSKALESTFGEVSEKLRSALSRKDDPA